jgi:hypothetical protein
MRAHSASGWRQSAAMFACHAVRLLREDGQSDVPICSGLRFRWSSICAPDIDGDVVARAALAICTDQA